MGFWHLYMGIEGGGEAAAVPDAWVTTRLTLVGASLYRVPVAGTSAERLTLEGSSR